jgi:predicted DNA-binding transcriptional regulator AlpA
MPRYGRFKHLQEMGLVNNWPTLLRWIEKEGFPPPIRLGQNTTAFDLDAVDKWVASRVQTPNAAA